MTTGRGAEPPPPLPSPSHHISSTCLIHAHRHAYSSVPHFPDEDAKLRATSIVTRRGGNGSNSLEVLQQFAPASDLALHLVATLPSSHSAATAKVLSSFGAGNRNGNDREEPCRVDFSRCTYREGETDAASSYILRSQATGSRTIVNHNGLAEMTIEEFVSTADEFREEDADTWWHFEVRV